MDIFGQSLELSKKVHLFRDFNVRDVSAYVLCQGDHSLRCSRVMYLLSNPISFKKNKTSGSEHAKGASDSALASHSQARTDPVIKHLPLRNACTT